ncbi:hypothetical protein [Arthrobacter sp. A5]|uniref:hypothetical protein n=1 Tax=Arthrobacter sp. A5 TaxID=576926 RepID=UPI003DA8992E
MKKFIRQHPYLYVLFSLVLLWVVASLLLRLFGSEWSEALSRPAGWMIVYVIFSATTIRQRQRRDAKLKAEGKTLAYIRYPNALLGSLSSTWNRGTAVLKPGKIEFQAAVYESLEPSGRPTTFTVMDAVTETKKLQLRQAKYITETGLQTMTLKTTTTDIEIAAYPKTIQEILQVVLDGAEESS